MKDRIYTIMYKVLFTIWQALLMQMAEDDLRSMGLDPEAEENQDALDKAFKTHKYALECVARKPKEKREYVKNVCAVHKLNRQQLNGK